MRWPLLLPLALAACTPRADTTTQPATPAPDAPAADAACVDVATATLDLGTDTAAPLVACGAKVDGWVGALRGTVRAVGRSQSASWVLTETALLGQAEGADWVVPLEGIEGTDVAAGFDRTAFVLDGVAGTIHRVEGEQVSTLVTDPTLENARALVRIGGSLFVGTPRGIAKVSLSDGSTAVLRDGLDVVDLTVDDIGALLVLVPGGLARVYPSGEDAPISASTTDARRIAFDLATSELLTIDGAGAPQRTAYAALVPEGPGSRPVAHGEMGPFLETGYILAGAEFWPHRGSTPAKYPEEILWGFYPHEGEVFEGSAAVATATDAATACAEQSYAALRAWIPTATDALAGATATGMAPRFYLWVNDYSEADDPFPKPMREAKLWYWARDPAVPGRIPGYFKWETVLDQTGECRWPQSDQAMSFLTETAAKP